MKVFLLFSIILFSILKSENTFSQEGRKSAILYMQTDGQIFRINNFEIFDEYELKEGKKYNIDITENGEIFGNAYPDFLPFILFSGDSLLIQKVKGKYKVSSFIDIQRTNDFEFLTLLIKELGAINKISSFEGKLPYFDTSKIYKPVLQSELFRFNSKQDSLLYDIYQKRITFLNTFKSQKIVSLKFETFFLQYIKYKYLATSLKRTILNEQLNIELPETLSSYINNIGLHISDSLFNVDEYRKFIVTLNQYYTLIQFENIQPENLLKSVKINFSTSKHQDYIAFFIADNYLRTTKKENIDTNFLNQYFNDFATSDYSQIIKNQYNLLFDKLSDQSDEVKNNKKEIKLFGNLFSSNSDTLYYIDFWASWCAPCRAELNSYGSFLKKIQDSKVKVIFISMDTNFESWKSAEKNYGFMNEGNSYVLVNNFESDVAVTNKIKEIPRYLLIKNGQIIQNNAPRPTDINLLKILKVNTD